MNVLIYAGINNCDLDLTVSPASLVEGGNIFEVGTGVTFGLNNCVADVGKSILYGWTVKKGGLVVQEVPLGEGTPTFAFSSSIKAIDALYTVQATARECDHATVPVTPGQCGFGTGDSTTFRYDRVPSAAINVHPGCQVGFNFTADALGSMDPDPAEENFFPLRYSWSSPGGTSQASSISFMPMATSFPVSLTVTNDFGAFDTETIQVSCAPAPTIDVSVTPSSVPVGQPAEFKAVVSGAPTTSIGWIILERPSGSTASGVVSPDGTRATITPDKEGNYILQAVAHTRGPTLIGQASLNATPAPVLPADVTVHIGQVIEDPQCPGCPDDQPDVVDLVQGKSGFAILRFMRDGSPVVGQVVEGLRFKYDSVEGVVSSNRTDSKGQLYAKFSPFRNTSNTIGVPVSLTVEYMDPASRQPSSKSKLILIRTTKSIRIGHLGIDKCNIPNICFSRLASAVSVNAKKSHAFIQSIYPVADTGIKMELFNETVAVSSELFSSGMKEDRKILLNAKKNYEESNGLLDRLFAYAPDGTGFPFIGYFSYRGYVRLIGEGAIGLASQPDWLILAEERRWTTGAHELAHSYCMRFDGLRGCQPDISLEHAHSHDPMKLAGYNVYTCAPAGEGECENIMPDGYVFDKYNILGPSVPDVDDVEILSSQWIDRLTYENQFWALLPSTEIEPSSLENQLTIGFEINSGGLVDVNYAIASGAAERAVPKGTDVFIKGKTKDGETVFDLEARSVAPTGDMVPSDGAPVSEQYEISIPNGLSLFSIEVSFRGKRLGAPIYPMLEIIRTAAGLVPTEAFVPGKGPFESELNRQLSAIEAALSGDLGLASAKILQLKNYISANILPVDSVDPAVNGQAQVIAATSDAVVKAIFNQLAESSSKNGLVAILNVSGLPGEKKTVVGRRLTTPAGPNLDLMVEVASPGPAHFIELSQDGSFAFDLASSVSDVEVKTYLVPRRENQTLRSAVRAENQKIAELQSALDLETDPVLIGRLERRIGSARARVRMMLAKIKSLARLAGRPIELSI